MLKAMQWRQINYFSAQQNKFMKTTNKEGGMRDPTLSQSFLNDHTTQSTCCFMKSSSQGRDLNMSVSMIDDDPLTHKVIPNNNQDMWLKYLILNLNQMDDLNWVQELL